MFQRIFHDEWVTLVPMLSFGLLFAVFLVTTVRALRLRASERDRLAALPLEDHPRELR